MNMREEADIVVGVEDGAEGRVEVVVSVWTLLVARSEKIFRGTIPSLASKRHLNQSSSIIDKISTLLPCLSSSSSSASLLKSCKAIRLSLSIRYCRYYSISATKDNSRGLFVLRLVAWYNLFCPGPALHAPCPVLCCALLVFA